MPTPETSHLTIPFTPVPRRFNRGDVWTEAVQRAFIEALADCGSVEAACRLVGRSPASAYRLRRHPLGGEFAQAWQVAVDCGVGRIEDYAMDRAINGVEVPVFAYGDKIATRRAYNDQLAMFMLRNRLPKRYCAGGGAKSLNAIDKRSLKRRKKEWRAEWEAEREASGVSPAEIRKVLDGKIAALKQAILARTSPVAYELELAKVAQHRADEAAGWDPREPYADFAAKAAELLPQVLAQVRAEWPAYEEAHAEWTKEEEEPLALPPPVEEVEEEDEAGPRVRTLKDEELR